MTAQVERLVLEKRIVPKGFNQIVGSSAAIGLGDGLTDDAVPEGALFALVQAEGGDVRYRDDGTDATADIGMLIPDGQNCWYCGTDLSAVSLFGDGTTINIAFYGE